MEIGSNVWTVREGITVVGSDGEKVGEVIGWNDTYIVVEKGFFFPTDYYIPSSAISSVGEEILTLNVTKDSALEQGWDVIPGDESVGTPGGAYLTGATSYDEHVGSDAEGAPITDADLRIGTEFDAEANDDKPDKNVEI